MTLIKQFLNFCRILFWRFTVFRTPLKVNDDVRTKDRRGRIVAMHNRVKYKMEYIEGSNYKTMIVNLKDLYPCHIW